VGVWWARQSDALKAAYITAVVGLVGTLIVALIGLAGHSSATNQGAPTPPVPNSAPTTTPVITDTPTTEAPPTDTPATTTDYPTLPTTEAGGGQPPPTAPTEETAPPDRQASPTAAVPFRIASVTWSSAARTGPSTAEPGEAVDIKITIDPDTADVSVACQDLSTGKRVPLDIGSRYYCDLPSYDATSGTHTVQVSVTARSSGYTRTKSISFTLTA
jgi:hypothetical protein